MVMRESSSFCVRAVDRKGFDVVSASAEKSGNARERAEFVGD